VTHDELLADIDLCIAHESEFGLKSIATAWKALRAVVELHKPIHHEYPNGNSETKCAHCYDGCWGCEEWGCEDCECKCHQAGDNYPCPTIQAIEKELK
jgi:hypothetical protein